MAHIQFILGGARSGKSAHAEQLAEAHASNTGSQLVYMATAEIFDDEMESRVQLHRDRRGPEWQLVEAPLDLPDAIRAADAQTTTILVDCLSVWTTNLLIHKRDLAASRDALLASLVRLPGKNSAGCQRDRPWNRAGQRPVQTVPRCQRASQPGCRLARR